MTVVDRERIINRTHRLGVGTNAALAGLKLTVGALAGSRALLADGVHSLSDVVMNAGAWIGWRWASRPPDRDHHYGHGNGEALTSLVVGLIIVAAGAGLIVMSIRGQSTVGPDALGIAAVSTEIVTILVKIGLARVTGRRGREFDSAILIAVARDNAADVLTSVLIMLAIVGSIFGLRWLEPAAACVIGALIGYQGLRSAYEGLNVLMDRVPDEGLGDRVAAVAMTIDGVVSVDQVRIHPLGTHLRADLEISVDGLLPVSEGHTIAHAVSDIVVAKCARVEEVAVHVNPH